jgi:hypothetical protein
MKGIRNLTTKLCLNNANGVITTNPLVLDHITSLYSRLQINSFFYPILQSESILKEELRRSIEISNNNIFSFDLSEKNIIIYWKIVRSERNSCFSKIFQINCKNTN